MKGGLGREVYGFVSTEDTVKGRPSSPSRSAPAEVSSELFHGLAQTLEREKSFLVDMGHIALFGVCGHCGGTP